MTLTTPARWFAPGLSVLGRYDFDLSRRDVRLSGCQLKLNGLRLPDDIRAAVSGNLDPPTIPEDSSVALDALKVKLIEVFRHGGS